MLPYLCVSVAYFKFCACFHFIPSTSKYVMAQISTVKKNKKAVGMSVFWYLHSRTFLKLNNGSAEGKNWLWLLTQFCGFLILRSDSIEVNVFAGWVLCNDEDWPSHTVTQCSTSSHWLFFDPRGIPGIVYSCWIYLYFYPLFSCPNVILLFFMIVINEN